MEENKIALSKKSNRVCLDNIVVFSFSEGYHLWILLLVKFHIYFIVQFYFEFIFVVKKASYIRAYSKSILSQLSLFRNKKKLIWTHFHVWLIPTDVFILILNFVLNTSYTYCAELHLILIIKGGHFLRLSVSVLGI